MFSIPVSELTPELLTKAEYWRLYAITPENRQWADVRHRERLILVCDRQTYPLTDAYASNVRAFPVTLSPDGTETRLECPRMQDEPEIGLKDQQWFHDGREIVGLRNPYRSGQIWVAIDRQSYASDRQMAPTHEHYPRRTLEGTWVWSTRR